MARERGAATPEKTSFAKRYFVPTERLDAIVTYAPFRSSVRVKSCASKNPKSIGLRRQLCLREDHDRHVF
jgi:hypothetical protein